MKNQLSCGTLVEKRGAEHVDCAELGEGKVVGIDDLVHALQFDLCCAWHVVNKPHDFSLGFLFFCGQDDGVLVLDGEVEGFAGEVIAVYKTQFA